MAPFSAANVWLGGKRDGPKLMLKIGYRLPRGKKYSDRDYETRTGWCFFLGTGRRSRNDTTEVRDHSQYAYSFFFFLTGIHILIYMLYDNRVMEEDHFGKVLMHFNWIEPHHFSFETLVGDTDILTTAKTATQYCEWRCYANICENITQKLWRAVVAW